VGPRRARHCALTAELIDAGAAVRYGLANDMVDDLEAATAAWLAAVLAGAPDAQAAIKALVHRVHGHPVDDGLIRETAQSIAELRARPEGREGLAAFFAKRPPRWAPTEE
jgi:methylglutaconyl-CoA hydratase